MWNTGGWQAAFGDRTVARYAFALLIFAAAFALRMAMLPVESGIQFLTFYPALIITVLLAGMGPGLLVLLLGGIAAQYAFIPPFWSFKMAHGPFIGALAIFYASGLLICLIASRMQKARSALTARQAELRAILDTVPAAIWVTRDPSAAVISGNRFANDLLGVGENGSVARCMTEEVSLVHDGRALRPGEMPIQHAATGMEVKGYEFDIVFKDGGTRSLFGHAVPLRDERGHLSGAVAAFIDVTGARAAALALRVSEERLRLSIEWAPAAIAMFDRDMRYMAVSRRFAEEFKIAPDDLIGRSHYDVFPEIPERWREVHRRCLAGATERCAEEPFVRQDGSVAWVSWEIRPWYEGDGRIGGIALFSENITWRKRAEDDLKAAKAEAERASLAKSKFLAAASHDLRQPVQALMLLLETLKPHSLTPPVARAVGLMEDALKGLNGLLSSILDVSRIDAGVVTPRMQAVDVGVLIRRLQTEYAPLCARKGLRLRVWCGQDVLAWSDGVLLERVVRNLIENSIRYTERGGVLIAARRRGEKLRIDVLDSGIGIPDAALPLIFEEFYQVGNQARDRTQGLGLGLAIVGRLVRLIGAEVRVRSRQGRGTGFCVAVPLCAASDRPVAPAAPVAAVTGRRVMVIEDDPTVRMGLQLMLEGWQCEVLGAATGEAALELGERDGWRFDVVLADHRLGAGLTGTETAAEIGRRAGRAIPTLIVTGDTAPERIQEVRGSGFEMLHKPIAPAELAGTMGRLLRSPAA